MSNFFDDDDDDVIDTVEDEETELDVFEETMKTLRAQNNHILKLTDVIRQHDTSIRQVKSDCISINKKVDYIIDNEYVSPAERQKIADAVKHRVADILMPRKFDGAQYKSYYKSFAKKAWIDAKREANVVGTGGVYTKRKHYKDAINYIATWEPEGYGIAGYFKHLEAIRSIA